MCYDTYTYRIYDIFFKVKLHCLLFSNKVSIDLGNNLEELIEKNEGFPNAGP